MSDFALTARPLVIAHRGASAEAPENTLAAFRLALEQGCDAIELDIHVSADGELVVCHDETLERTTDGTGRIAEMTAAELKRFDAGAWFGAKYRGERLPLLQEVLELVPPRIGINVEIKSFDHPGVERLLVDLLERTGRTGSVFLSSFDHDCMVRCKRLSPSLRVGLLYEEEEWFDYEAFERENGIALYSMHMYHGCLNGGFAAAAARRGLQVYPWTVDDPLLMRRMLEWGASGIITNRPGVLRKLLEENGGTHAHD
ncbi:glycerophosphodiester phosphodiesterase [Cohnella caldifontis]|uniref:glycerophosphodiester phosphodiesterase n=1 Tax=Cohnella caldifontis TaxID=3027471 RepID=UPI0023EC1C10|nr:glycerophosphodiester phosphodiesterase [Cohnella sp. YIM B05605]